MTRIRCSKDVRSSRTPVAPDHTRRIMRLDRRMLLKASMAGAVVAPLIACTENPATGRKQFILAPDDVLAQLSEQTWAEILRTVPQSQDAGAKRKLERVGERIASVSALTGIDWEFVAFDSPERIAWGAV